MMASGSAAFAGGKLAASGCFTTSVELTLRRCSWALTHTQQRCRRNCIAVLPLCGLRTMQRTSMYKAESRPVDVRQESMHDIISQAGGPPVEAMHQESERHYQQMKTEISSSTRTFSSLLVGYLMLVSTFDVAGCAAAGSMCGYWYVQLLIRDVDNLNSDDPVAAVFLMQSDARLQLQTLRSLQLVAAAYRAALKPRLLVLVGVGCSAAAYNAMWPNHLSMQAVAALFAGFLSYKAGLAGQIWRAATAKSTSEDAHVPYQPVTEAEELTPEEWRHRLNGRRH